MNTEQAYTVLGIFPGADPKDVQRAYRERALESHPDRASSDAEAALLTKRFMKIRDAYEHLRSNGFPIPEPQTIVKDPPKVRTVHRSFVPKEEDIEEVGIGEKLGLGFSVSVESIVLWGVLIPGGAILLIYFLKFLSGVLRS